MIHFSSIGIAFASVCDDTEILALTVVNGNTSLDQCAINAKLIVDKIFAGKTKPPIYIGARHPIAECVSTHDFYYGKDGLTGTTLSDYKVEVDKIKEEQSQITDRTHAALKILELVEKYPNEVTILALGPLTNLALAVNLSHDPDSFTRKIKKIFIMGGSEPPSFSEYPDSSNEVNYPEFNFRLDAIAAKIVFDRYKCPISVFTFDTCLRSFQMPTVDLQKEFDKYRAKSERCDFLANIGLKHRVTVANPHIFRCCDLLATIGTFYENQCNGVSKRLGKYTIETNDKKLDGIFKLDDSADEKRDIELCILMDMEKTVAIFKDHLQKLAKLDFFEN